MGVDARLRVRIAALVVLGALVVATGVALLLSNTVGLRESSNSAVSSENYLLRAVNVERLVVDVETGLRGYVITGRSLFLQPLYSARAELPAAEAALAQSAAANHVYGAQSAALTAAVRSYLSRYIDPLLATASRDLAAVRSFQVTLEGKHLVDGIRTRAAMLEQLVSTHQAARQRAAHNSADHSIFEAILVLVALTLLTALLGTILGRLVVERERARARSEATSQTLQQSILPAGLATVPGCEVASRFIPAAGLVGGDFYDAFAIAPLRWAIIIGDVSGKGPAAAALTAMARWTLRSSLESSATPAEALRLLNRAMLRQDAQREFVTAACIALELSEERARAEVICAGHPAPIFVPGDGDPALVDADGTLLGLVPDIDLRTATLQLSAGDSLVAYTDGVTDQGPELREPERALGGRAAGADADVLADMLVALSQGPTGRHRDDVAIVAVRFVGDGASAAAA